MSVLPNPTPAIYCEYVCFSFLHLRWQFKSAMHDILHNINQNPEKCAWALSIVKFFNSCFTSSERGCVDTSQPICIYTNHTSMQLTLPATLYSLAWYEHYIFMCSWYNIWWGDFKRAKGEKGDLRVRYILTPSHAGIVIRFGLSAILEICILLYPYVEIEHKNTKNKNLLTSRQNLSCGQTSCVFGTTNRASR